MTIQGPVRRARSNEQDSGSGAKSVDGAGLGSKGLPPNLPVPPPPNAQPPFSLGDIRKAIPPECFVPSTATSFYYIALDFLKTAVVWGALLAWEGVCARLSLPSAVYWAVYVPWSFYLGAIWFGIFVIGHECGHGATFGNDYLNEVVGFVLHTLLVVPYHAWRVTHANHHLNTGSLDHDEVFSPELRSEYGKNPKFTLLDGARRLVVWLTIGWPMYLLFNATGPLKHREGRMLPPSHFEPSSSLFRKRDYWWVILSAVGVVSMLAVLGEAVRRLSLSVVLRFYGGPWLWFTAILVIVTWLQHTDVYMPHLAGEEWTWLRGALCTADRSWGAHLDWTMHFITNHHVVHHIFPRMPFYHHPAAAAAIKPILGSYYLYDPTPLPQALWRVTNKCWFIDEGEKIAFYKDQ